MLLKTEDIKPDNQLPVIVGRFSPLHLGHCEVIENTLKLWSNLLIVIASETFFGRSEKTPFTSLERDLFMINYQNSKELKDKFRYDDGVSTKVDNIITDHIFDVNNAKLWMTNLEEKIKFWITALYLSNTEPIFIVGRPEDSKFYNIPKDDGTERYTYKINTRTDISGTMIREKLTNKEDISEFVPAAIHDKVVSFWSHWEMEKNK